jgi:uncharacterized protein (TIGR02453 family)
MPAFFTKEVSSFLKGLSENNNRDWFNANKDRFKEFAEKPFHQFIDKLIEKIKAVDPRITITSKESVFRIYKDIRFSKDKTPYKEFLSALISPGGRKDHSTPGLYIEMKANEMNIYSGVYEPDPKQLLKIRSYIASHLKEFDKALADKKFVKRYGKILGDKNKVLPADLKEAAAKQELIYNKNFYYTAKLDKSWITSDKLLNEVVQCYKDALAMSSFFEKALKGK